MRMGLEIGISLRAMLLVRNTGFQVLKQRKRRPKRSPSETCAEFASPAARAHNRQEPPGPGHREHSPRGLMCPVVLSCESAPQTGPWVYYLCRNPMQCIVLLLCFVGSGW